MTNEENVQIAEEIGKKVSSFQDQNEICSDVENVEETVTRCVLVVEAGSSN